MSSCPECGSENLIEGSIFAYCEECTWSGDVHHLHESGDQAMDAEAPTPVIGDITREAHEIVTIQRDSHGDAYENHQQIADLWSDFIGDYEFEAWEAAIMVALIKTSRMQAGTLDKDHFRDIAGYADVAWDSAVRDPNVETEEDP